jgi:hypothetical protein
MAVAAKRATFTPPTGSRQHEQAEFAEKVLGGLGIPFNTTSMTKFMAWEQQEGGNWSNSAKYNPLNTTLALPGAGNTGSQGNIKVYTSWQQGVEATVKTLGGSAYAGIRANLAGSGDLASFETAVNASPWGAKFPGGGKGGGEGRGPSSIPGGETNLPEDAEKAASKATAWVGELTSFAGKEVITGVLLLAGAFLIVYGIMVAVRPRESAMSLPRMPIPVPV